MSFFSLAPTAFATLLENVANQALRYDPGSRYSLGDLKGRRVRLELTQPNLDLIIVFTADSQNRGEVCILADANLAEAKPDCTIRGSLFSLVQLSFNTDVYSLANSGVEIDGDISLAQTLTYTLKNVDIDWEELFSKVGGDILTPPISRAFYAQFTHWRKKAEQCPEYIAEVLSEELKLLPSKNEAQSLFDDIDNLRSDTDRVEARIQQLLKIVKITKQINNDIEAKQESEP